MKLKATVIYLLLILGASMYVSNFAKGETFGVSAYVVTTLDSCRDAVEWPRHAEEIRKQATQSDDVSIVVTSITQSGTDCAVVGYVITNDHSHRDFTYNFNLKTD